MLIGKKIYATLQRRWQFRNADTERLMNITPGRYELESMENPFGNRSPWLVLKGTKLARRREHGTIGKKGKVISRY